MSDTALDFLDPQGPEAEAPPVADEAPVDAAAAEPQGEAQAEAEPAKPAPERGPDGKFAPKAQAAPDPAQVPISAMLDERDKRQAAEKRARELEERWAEVERQAATPATDAETLQAALYAQNLRASRKFAEREYGKETVASVHDWAAARCDADPHFNAQMRASDDPYEAAIQAYNREQIAAKVTPERLAAFEAWEAAQAGQAHEPQAHQPGAPPPRSLVNAPGNGLGGKQSPVPEEGSAFGALFGS